MRALPVVLLMAMSVSCSSPPEQTAAPPASAPAPQAVAPARQPLRISSPPSRKDVIDAVLSSASLPLSTSPTCSNVGTEPADATIGRYLAGFMAALSSPDKKNWIETKVEPGRSAAGEPASVCTLILRHQDGDDEWGWGVRFHVRSSDGLVLPDSFTCVGAG